MGYICILYKEFKDISFTNTPRLKLKKFCGDFIFVAFLVTSEYSNGTIRQMACRGIYRWKLVLGQYIAMVIFKFSRCFKFSSSFFNNGISFDYFIMYIIFKKRYRLVC